MIWTTNLTKKVFMLTGISSQHSNSKSIGYKIKKKKFLLHCQIFSNKAFISMVAGKHMMAFRPVITVTLKQFTFFTVFCYWKKATALARNNRNSRRSGNLNGCSNSAQVSSDFSSRTSEPRLLVLSPRRKG